MSGAGLGSGHGPATGPHAHAHDPAHAHEHDWVAASHAGAHEHHPGHTSGRLLELNRSLLEKNARLAERNRGFFRAKKLLVLNVMSAPGSGKTTFIRETARRLAGRLRPGVITGDLATDNDAAALRAAGIPVVQINTGTVCHLDAEMVARAAGQLDLDALEVLVIENVGNLVCPADYDLGEDLRVVLLSVTEGEDKPLKYPPLFHSAHVAVVTKSDLAAAAGFQRELALANLRRISHHAHIFEVSARTGAGMDAWVDYLEQQRAARGHAQGWL
ncbi:MAG: hydrogenase nickel incorporation protein HypB [Verrucomicrobiales bacterium]|nr:hydrogenase nickel incorporation protein HypB [Verrucomicrobiales bacterium]